MSEFSRLMQVQRVRERQLEDERFGAGDTSRETLARTLKTALSEMPRKLRECCKTRGLGCSDLDETLLIWGLGMDQVRRALPERGHK